MSKGCRSWMDIWKSEISYYLSNTSVVVSQNIDSRDIKGIIICSMIFTLYSRLFDQSTATDNAVSAYLLVMQVCRFLFLLIVLLVWWWQESVNIRKIFFLVRRNIRYIGPYTLINNLKELDPKIIPEKRNKNIKAKIHTLSFYSTFILLQHLYFHFP